MGCDIHFYVEFKRNGRWQSADKWRFDDEYADVSYTNCFYGERNYSLFAILANVRNGYGFGGVDTGDGFVPIDKPRGLPHDVTNQIKESSDRWDCDGHNHSWFTLQEILEYDWTRVTKKRGVLTLKEYDHWRRSAKKRGESPESYAAEVWSKDACIVSEHKADEILHSISTSNYEKIYVRCEWEVAYHKCCYEFWWNTIPRMLALGKPEDVRCVFWFDN
jgi:hypothetical protein